MKHVHVVMSLLLASTTFAQTSVPEIPFDSVPDFLKLPPDMHLGEASGVAVNSHGHVFVANRGGTVSTAFQSTASQVLEFGPDGNFIREIGKNLYAWSYAHTVRIDKDDNIWAVDKGSDMAVKFNPEGRVMMLFGRKPESPHHFSGYDRTGTQEELRKRYPHVDGQFRQPTDVTWDPQGNIFISDGYVNSRVAKFDKSGDWVKSFGERGAKPGEFNTAHSIASDAQGNIYVADRTNRRTQVFNSDGVYLRSITSDAPLPPGAQAAIGNTPTGPAADEVNGAPWAICITPGPNQFLYVSDAFPGRIYKHSLDGKLLGVLGKSGKQLKQFGWIHEMACPSENELFVAELLNWRVQKLTLHPAGR